MRDFRFSFQCLMLLSTLPYLSHSMVMISKPIVRVSEHAWRKAVSQHKQNVREILLPGLLPPDKKINCRRQRSDSFNSDSWLTGLNPKHPVYNFLIEYYGLKGRKGTRRLMRWSPKPELLMQTRNRITHENELTSNLLLESEPIFNGILLEGASENDLGGTLHLKGATIQHDGVLYSLNTFFEKEVDQRKSATPYIWYQRILQQTLTAEPVLHCHGLHEWAMQYWPPGAESPPSAKYQSHLPLRVSREVINANVERSGISCTHVDALRYFAPAAGPLNYHGYSLHRDEQLTLEQPACVHAHMDLLKMIIRLQPFCDPLLLQRVLKIALDARKIDVAASPYDGTTYGVGIIPVETSEGRAEYRRQQMALMLEAEPARQDLADAYSLFLKIGFGENVTEVPSSERFAKAEPGGLPWRKNPISL